MRGRMMLMAMAFAALLGGCGDKTNSESLMKGAISDYNAQKYVESQRGAEMAMMHAQSPAKEEAAYLAGMSAYKRGLTSLAEEYFTTAEGSRDVQVAGKAEGMLGIIRMDQGRATEAAALFAESSAMLSGDDSRQAAARAAEAYQRSGDSMNAAKWRDKAGISGTNEGMVVMGSGTASNGSASVQALFTLQAGAFAERNRAEKAADECRQVSQRFGLGEVRIVPSHDSRGKAMYLVQFGVFQTRTEAASVRSKIGKLEYIVAAATN
ncbi:MAG TPA: SPOR domain-containing protein [Phycisphaerales bacterium]|nr:SPOR domain-containing protein [Phycisphaerales bacterium]